MTDEEVNLLLDHWFMPVVNIWRDHTPDDDPEAQRDVARMTSDLTGLPQWMVLRIGKDMNVLHPDLVQLYEELRGQSR